MCENKNVDARNFLHANTKRAKWGAVVKKIEENPEAQKLKLTQQGDTALHLAVIDNQEQVVQELVQLIRKSKDYKKLLETTNERGNNPLHLAAVMGSVRMCHAIASAHDRLVHMRNKEDETPLFLAAVYGNRGSFYCLYHFCGNDASQIASNCRVKNRGDTVLHCALRNEHFDLAFQLIHMNDDAMHWVTEEGITALHVLASKPTSFKSGSQIRGWRNIIYYCTFVDLLKPKPIETLTKACKESMSQADTTAASYFPGNYETCIDFLARLWDGFLKVSTLKPPVNQKKIGEVKNGMYLDKDRVNNNVESENMGTDESCERLDTGLHKAHGWANFPKNYITCIHFFQMLFSAILIVLGFGSAEIRNIRENKENHTWSVQVMEKLLEFAESDRYDDDGRSPMDSKFQTDEEDEVTRPYNFEDGEVQFSNDIHSKPKEPERPKDHVLATETAMLLAAKNGVIEIVKGLYERFPLAICDARKDKKNVVLLAAEYRQPDVYRFLLQNKDRKKNLFRAVDHKGNSALHLAAAAPKSMLWRISGATLQLQWEVKWYKFIEESVPLHFFAHYNKEGKTAATIFHESHMDEVKKSGDWLTKTSKSASVVGALIVAVAFTSASTIPGGFDPKTGDPFLEKHQAFFMFSVFSLIALCLSSTAVTMFLAILTHRFDADDFISNLPFRLLLAFSSLFFSIISILVSYCAGHYFLIHDHLRNSAAPLYTLIFLPVALFFLASKLPLYIDLLQAIFITVPSRSFNVLLSDHHSPSKPLRQGKFQVASIPLLENLSPASASKSKPLSSIFTPTTEASYPVIFFLPASLVPNCSDFLQLVASQGFVIVGLALAQFRSGFEMNEAESSSQVKTWPVTGSDQEEVEAELLKVARIDVEETKLRLTFGQGPPTNPFSAVIGFDPPPGTKFCIPHSQITRTQPNSAPQSSNTSSPILHRSQFLISKLCATVKSSVSQDSS